MGETRNCFKPVTCTIKLLGAFPVSENGNKISFKCFSLRSISCFILFLFFLIHISCNIYENVIGFATMVYDLNGIATQISFFILAMHWPDVVKECDRIDMYMTGYGFPKYLKLKLHVVCVMLITFRLGLTILLDVSLLQAPGMEMHSAIGVCRAIAKSFTEGTSFAAAWKLLLMTVRQVSRYQTVMLRICGCIFIITASVILTMRFRQVVKQIDLLIRRKIRNKGDWMRAREDYQRICVFCEKWNNVLGYLVICSFTSSIYNVLVHIQEALRASDTIKIVFTITLSTVSLLQCIAICYTAGNVHEEIRRLVRVLLLTPSDVFNDEIERMILEIRQLQPALTGKQLFTVKHSLILQILGGVVTHEMILLQYYKPPEI